MAYICQCCGETHEGLPLDIAFDKPGAYFLTPARQRKAKWKLSSDACVLGGKRFFIRGCLFVPLRDIREFFVWGVWAEVSAHVFERHQALFDKDGTQEPPYPGALSVERTPCFRGMDQLPITLRLGPADQRPRFSLQPSNHWLCRDQHNGITLHRVHEMLHGLFPEHF